MIREAINLADKRPPVSAPFYGTTPKSQVPRTQNPFSTSEAPLGPFEYKLADAIGRTWEAHTLSQPYQPSDPGSWSTEVDRAAAELEEAIIDSGVMNDVFKLIEAIEEKLHDGEYHHDINVRSNIPK